MPKAKKKNKSKRNRNKDVSAASSTDQAGESASTTPPPPSPPPSPPPPPAAVVAVPSTSAHTEEATIDKPVEAASTSSEIVPDDVLKKLVCHNCDKYLSMLPVKLSKYRHVCGRCVTQLGASSSYNSIANLFLFKCHNRVDGCTKLLRCSEVQKHELQCPSTNNICPICLVQMPTYMILPHFNKYHDSSVLTDDCFMLDLLYHAVSTDYVFLYRHLDFLIVINVSVKTDCGTYVVINPVLMRREISKMNALHMKFIMHLERDNVRESCFKLIDLEHSLAKHEHAFHVTARFYKKYSQAFVTFVFKELDITRQPKKCKKKDYLQQIWWRKIVIDDIEPHFREYFLMKSGTIFDWVEEKSIYLFCINCKMWSQFEEDYRKSVYLHVNDSEYHLLCSYCLDYLKCRGMSLKTTLTSRIIPSDVYKRFKFECYWSCKQSLHCNRLPNHELKCESMPKMKCICKKNVVLSDFDSHFKRFHLPSEPVEYRNLITTNPFLYDFINMKSTIVTLWIGQSVVSIKFIRREKYTDISVAYLIVRESQVSRRLRVLIYQCDDHSLVETLDSKGGRVHLSTFMVKVYYQYEFDNDYKV